MSFFAAQTALALQVRMQSRVNFVVEQVSNLIFYICATCALAIIVWRFGTLGGFGRSEIMLVYGLNLATYFLAGTYLWGIARTLEGMIRTGELDLVLLKPAAPLCYLMVRSFELSMPVKAIGALVLCVYALWSIEGSLGPLQLAWLACALVGGTLVQGGIMLGFSSIAFWTAGSRDLVEVLIYSVRRFIDLPISIYPLPIQLVLTIVVPYAFVNFYPVSGLVAQPRDLAAVALALSPLPSGIIVAAAGYALWRLGLRRYTRVGG